MPAFRVETPQRSYSAVVERGVVERAAEFLPANAGKVFVVSSEDVWRWQGAALEQALTGRAHELLFLPGGEENKRLAPLEALAEDMVTRGGDRTSVVVAFGGGVVGDMAGFLAAMFMRGIPVLQIPTTLLAQVDAGVGGKTGVNLHAGKNLIGAFHQPVAVLIDPAVLSTLPEREYRAGLYEIVKTGVIRDAGLFRFLTEHAPSVLARQPGSLDRIIADSVRVKAEVVSADEREGGLRRILNFGHTFGHTLEAETAYKRYLHGEAVGFGMKAAVHLATATGRIAKPDAEEILRAIDAYGPLPSFEGIAAENLVARLLHDKKTVQGRVHFVLPLGIGEVAVVSGVEEELVLDATRLALA